MEKVDVIYSEKFVTRYDTVDYENPDRMASIWSTIRDISALTEPEPCSIEDLLSCHSRTLVASVADDKEVYDVASLAAGGAIKAAELCFHSPTFALVRPPGHHAGFNFNGGFCFFNNMAIAAKSLVASARASSVLIVDIDLHFGNGTQDILKDEKKVTFRNISGGTRKDFFGVLEGALADALDYEVVACSAGFDTYVNDWGGLLLTEDFRRIGSMLASSAPHLYSVLEGGYYIQDLGKNVRAYLEGIASACS